MALVRLTNREKAMFLNLAFRDELRFTAYVIAEGLQLPLYRGNCKASRAGGPRSRVAACSCLPTAHLVGSRVPRDRGRAGARPSRERCRPRRGVALPRGATIGCVPINLNPLNPLNLLNTLNPLNLLNLLNHQDRYLAEM